MTIAKWTKLLSNLETITTQGEVSPVDSLALDEFEAEYGKKLPSSYREFCMVFGAGQLGNHFNIAVPGYRGSAVTFDVQHLTRSQIALADQFAELGVDPTQVKRGLFFALDSDGSNHFFDTDKVYGKRRHEYAIYTLFRDCRLKRTADTFWQFVNDFCLGDQRGELIETQRPVERVFRPVSK